MLFAAEAGPGPEWLYYTDVIFGMNVIQWVGLLLAFPIAWLAGQLLQSLVVRIARSLVGKTGTDWDDRFVRLLPGPTRVFFALLVLYWILDVLQLPTWLESTFNVLLRTGLIAGVTWFLLKLLHYGSEFVESQLTRKIDDEVSRRAIHTQIAVPQGIIRFLLIGLAVALSLLQFEGVRTIGASLLGLAGIAATAAVLSAQKTLGNVFAGLQIALFQPVRLGDVVVVEGEWGTIEEITITYVTVRIWDLRRLVLPVSYFIEKPIENWTKTGTEVLGTIFIYTDYTVPIDDVRKELDRIVESEDGSKLWDGKVKGLIVTNLTKETAELRALVSAKDSSDIWNLRCLVREKLLAWLQSQGKSHMPLNRVTLERAPENGQERQSIVLQTQQTEQES